MADMMPKKQADYIHDVELYCLNATNMTEQEAYNFAFRCWQLGFEKKKHIVKEIFEDIDNALHDMATEYTNAGHPEYFAVCEMVHHKVIRPTEKKYTEGEG